MWAYSPQKAKIANFWDNFAQKGYTRLSDFLNTKFGLGRESQVRAVMLNIPNITVVALKTWTYSP